jgi:hypothetical protein
MDDFARNCAALSRAEGPAFRAPRRRVVDEEADVVVDV